MICSLLYSFSCYPIYVCSTVNPCREHQLFIQIIPLVLITTWHHANYLWLIITEWASIRSESKVRPECHRQKWPPYTSESRCDRKDQHSSQTTLSGSGHSPYNSGRPTDRTWQDQRLVRPTHRLHIQDHWRRGRWNFTVKVWEEELQVAANRGGTICDQVVNTFRQPKWQPHPHPRMLVRQTKLSSRKKIMAE